MTKKNMLLIVTAVVLAAVYVVYFTDWFKPKTVQMFHTNRNLHPRMVRGGNGALPGLIFGINQPLRLTEIKVIPLAAFQTNENALPVWHMISDSNSVPVRQFHYGEFIRGMRSAVKGARPQVLETNITYHMVILAGRVKGENDFDLK